MNGCTRQRAGLLLNPNGVVGDGMSPCFDKLKKTTSPPSQVQTPDQYQFVHRACEQFCELHKKDILNMYGHDDEDAPPTPSPGVPVFKVDPAETIVPMSPVGECANEPRRASNRPWRRYRRCR